jgi:orotate phosphoribosyltransferase
MTTSILSIFKETGALLEGHFQLTSGLHSDRYFQCAKVLQHPRHLTHLASIIADHYRSVPVDIVISPALGGIVLGTEVGRLLDKRTLFAERKEGVMQIRRGFEVAKGERVLVIEDVVTTGGSVKEVIARVQELGGVVAGVGYIVDRSNGRTTFGVPHFSVVSLDVVAHTPESCPMCAAGSTPVKPGSRGA